MISIESSIVKALLYDEEYARTVVPHLKPEFFDGHYKEIFVTYNDIFEKYHKIPTVEALVIGLKGKNVPEETFESAIQELSECYKSKDESVDTKWLVDETEKYCVDKALFNAIYQSISILEGNDKKLDKHAIPTILDEALSVSFDTTVGSDYFEDLEKRLDYYTNPDSKLPFPLNALNILSNNGLPPKTLSAVLAFTNTGKSALMCYLSGEYLKAGKNVLYITLEMSEEAVQERVDANLMDMKTDEFKNKNLNKDLIRSKMAELRKRTTGRFIVKEYPTGAGHVGHFRHLLRELQQKKKFKPDIIFVDYINICASSRYKTGTGVNSYTLVKSIAEELRGLAVEQNLPIFTATQTNRDAANNQSPDMTATSECLTLDTVVITNKGKKQIKDVNVGDKLLGSDGFVTVSMVHHPKTKRVYEIKTKSGKVIRCSADHVFPTNNGRLSIKSGLVPGMILNSIDL